MHPYGVDSIWSVHQPFAVLHSQKLLPHCQINSYTQSSVAETASLSLNCYTVCSTHQPRHKCITKIHGLCDYDCIFLLLISMLLLNGMWLWNFHLFIFLLLFLLLLLFLFWKIVSFSHFFLFAPHSFRFFSPLLTLLIFLFMLFRKKMT